MQIGLIAMSGIRACDAKLLELGLTLPGFVERSKTIASLPSLGLLTLAGMTPPPHRVAYREVPDVKRLGPELESFDLVAISTFTAQVEEAYALADRYRAQGTKVVIGGLHVTTEPEEAVAHADAVVVGQGEPVWTQLLADAGQGQLQRLYRADGRTPVLADPPMPSFDLLDLSRYNRLTVQTSRGCPWKCSFCASSILLTPLYQQKPAAAVLREIDLIRELWPHPFIEFADDNSFVNKPYWKQLLPQLASRHVKWFAETDVSVADDEDLLTLLRTAGCAEVLIGLESPVEEGLAGLELKSDWKRKRAPRYREAVRRIQSHGIRVNGCFILGLDEHGPEVFDLVYRFVEETELYDVQITYPTPFPGTPMYRSLKQQGRLLEEKPWAKCTLFDVTFTPARMSVGELTAGFHDLTKRLYSREFTQWRRDTFKAKYLRPARDEMTHVGVESE